MYLYSEPYSTPHVKHLFPNNAKKPSSYENNWLSPIQASLQSKLEASFSLFPHTATDHIADSTDFRQNTVFEQTKTDISGFLGRKVKGKRKHRASLHLQNLSATGEKCPKGFQS